MENARVLKEHTILNDQYEILKTIGEGGFGITYLAFDKYLKINLCIKEYFPTAFATRDISVGNDLVIISGEREKLFRYGMNKFEKEANILSKFSDLEGTVKILNFFFQNNTAYMVMEYIVGISLKDYLEQNGDRLDYHEVLELMHPVIKALSVIHNSGLIHRDISPDNIMYSTDGKIKIIDFGSAKAFEDDKSQVVMLKHGYAPPEQYSKDGKQGKWTDIYSLCATMYRMITGVRMPESLSIMSGAAKVKGIRSFDRNVPVKVENAIMHGLELSSDNRIQTMEELEECLYGYINVKREERYSANKSNKKIWGVMCLGTIIVVGLIAFVVVNVGDRKLVGKREPVVGFEDGSSNDTSTKEADNRKSNKSTSKKNNKSNKEDENVTILEEYRDLRVPFESSFGNDTSSDGIVITSVSNTIDKLAYPSMIGGKAVVEINASSKNVVIALVPEGVKRIGDNAFKNCVYLENVYIPSTVEYIGETAFSNCKNLKRIDISADNPNYYVKDNTEIKAY